MKLKKKGRHIDRWSAHVPRRRFCVCVCKFRVLFSLRIFPSREKRQKMAKNVKKNGVNSAPVVFVDMRYACADRPPRTKPKKGRAKKKNPVRQNSVNPCGRFVAVVAILSADALTATAANRPNSTKKSSFAYYDVIFAGAVANRPRPQGTKEGGGRGVFICIL